MKILIEKSLIYFLDRLFNNSDCLNKFEYNFTYSNEGNLIEIYSGLMNYNLTFKEVETKIKISIEHIEINDSKIDLELDGLSFRGFLNEISKKQIKFIVEKIESNSISKPLILNILISNLKYQEQLFDDKEEYVVDFKDFKEFESNLIS